MDAHRFWLLLIIPMITGLAGWCVPAASWDGLVGLYTQPTAETFQPGQAALTFSEIRFSQERENCEQRDTWFAGSLTTTLSPHWEIGLTSRHELIDYCVDDSLAAVSSIDDVKIIGDVKYIITPPQGKRIGVAVGIQDITDTTDEIDGFDVDRGRRFFVVGSYQWAHLGLTADDRGLGAYVGGKFRVSETFDLVAEYVTKPSFVAMDPQPANTVNFNLGARIYPREVPGLHIDASAVGDGVFRFGFSLSYQFRLFRE